MGGCAIHSQPHTHTAPFPPNWRLQSMPLIRKFKRNQLAIIIAMTGGNQEQSIV